MIGETAHAHHRARWKRLRDRLADWRTKREPEAESDEPVLDVKRLEVCGSLTEVTR